MFTPQKRDLPLVEKHILDMLGPRELVKAKQVGKQWATAVRRYVDHADANRISNLMEMAFFEPVPIYAVVDLGQTVRDLTINENKEVYVLGNVSVIQLDTEDFNMNKTMWLEMRKDPNESPTIPRPRRGFYWGHLTLYCSNDGRKFEVDGFYNWIVYEYKKRKSSEVLRFVSRRRWHKPEDCKSNPKVVDTKIVSKTRRDPNLRQLLAEKLGFCARPGEPADLQTFVELASNTYLVSAPNQKNNKETLVAMVCEKDNSMTMKLIAKIRLAPVKIRVIGTRVFCYENINNTMFKKPSNHIIIFDVWNPMSVKSLVGPVKIKRTNIRSSKTVKPLEVETEENWNAIWESLL